MKPIGPTPQTEHPELAAALGIPRLFLKREDLHPYGSHKGRSIPLMIDEKAAAGARDFAISSSGNAALAAVRHIQKRNEDLAGLSLSVLVGEGIGQEKLARLVSEIRDDRVTLTQERRPLQRLLDLVKGGRRESLRQSTDDLALLGYGALADELSAVPGLTDVFIPCSSGTAAQSIAQRLKDRGLKVSVHIVQTGACFPLAEAFDERPAAPSPSAADAIVDKVAHRREALVALLKETGGTGWIASESDIAAAVQDLKTLAGIEATANGALGLAGLMRARAKGRIFAGTVACVITGR